MLEEEENWENLSFTELNDRRGGFRYFDSKGLLFHLPTYLICELSNKLNTHLIDFFISTKHDELANKFIQFNYDQMRLVINCFEYFLQTKGSLDSNDNENINLISSLNKILNTKLPLNEKNYTGKWIAWYENGVKQYEAEYKDGKLNGKEMFWYTNGAKNSENEYKNGIINGKATRWYPNGSLKSEGEYKSGKSVNKYMLWYENGDKQWEDIFNDKDGSPIGRSISWHKNGNKEKEVGYLGDLPHGKYLKWDENGKVLIDQDYKDGVMSKDNLAQKNKEGIDLE